MTWASSVSTTSARKTKLSAEATAVFAGRKLVNGKNISALRATPVLPPQLELHAQSGGYPHNLHEWMGRRRLELDRQDARHTKHCSDCAPDHRQPADKDPEPLEAQRREIL